MRSVRRRDGHHDRQARTIGGSGGNRGWLRVNLGITTRRNPCFVLERAPLRGLRSESLSRQLRRSGVRPDSAVVEVSLRREGLSRCGSTSKIPDRSTRGDTSGLRALAVPNAGHTVRPNCSLEQTRGRSFEWGTGGSKFETRCLRSPATLPRAAQLEC